VSPSVLFGLGGTVSGKTRTTLLSLGLCLLVVVLFDLAAYPLLPPGLVARFYPYRCPACVPPPAVPGGGTALHDYYVAHEERGFDIAPNRRGLVHYVDGTFYPVWSNALGCFDAEPRIGDGYVYLAGDSFAWGFTPFEDKLGTVLERRLGLPVVKCGVAGTGQLHQLSKLKEAIAALGRKPLLIVDTYFENDVADDLAYPSNTVVGGWTVAKMHLVERDGRYVVRPRSPAEIEAAADVVPAVGPLDGLWYALARYSLSFDIARGLLARVQEGPGGREGTGAGGLKRIYQPGLWQRDGRFWYADNPYAARNRTALGEMKAYADALDVPLFLLLIPPKGHATEPHYYDELKAALRAMGIGFADAAEHFAQKGSRWWELYWPRDAHLDPNGNRVVGDFLAERVGPLLYQSVRRH
jgi:hypothetical protein